MHTGSGCRETSHALTARENGIPASGPRRLRLPLFAESQLSVVLPCSKSRTRGSDCNVPDPAIPEAVSKPTRSDAEATQHEFSRPGAAIPTQGST